MMRAVRPTDVKDEAVGSMRDGVLIQRHILKGKDGTPNNYDLNIGRTGKGGWGTPRHRHNFDQIRYVIDGDYPYADGRVMPQGWVGYFPESVHYGPQDRPEGLRTLVLQVGGASGFGYLSVEQRESANNALKQKGEFKNGKFNYVDENGVQQTKDASVACFEFALGRKLEFAEPRYGDVILMNPAASEWIPQKEKGVSVKWLGTFTERELRIGMIKLDAGAVYRGGEYKSLQLLFQIDGQISAEGASYEAESAYELDATNGLIELCAEKPTKLLCYVLHKF